VRPNSLDRRDFLKAATATVIGSPLASAVWAGAASAAPAGSGGVPSYDAAANFEITVTEVEMRRTVGGRMLMARIYRPVGAGPFPTVIDLHGGAWNAKDRTAEAPMDRAIAGGGALVVAIDMTRAGEAPYPACVQDANYAVRWLKANAAKWSGDASRIGVFASSSGGQVAELLAMRPGDARYAAIPLPEAPNLDATVAYVATRSPVSNTFARFENAQRRNNDAMVKNNLTYFVPFDTIHESNPQEILERGAGVALPPLLIMQGALDDNVLPAVQEKFAATYKAAGGNCEFQLFEGCVHEWVAEPGPQTDRAHDMVKAFIARRLTA
jgi:acetyl esterase